MSAGGLFLFSCFWVIFIYGFNCILQKRLIVPEKKFALLYISIVIFIGVFGEVFIDTIYNFVFGQPLWEYHLLPKHSAYTSYYSLFIWGLYGFHLYLFHGYLKNHNIVSTNKLAAIISLEALLLEVIFNLLFLVLSGKYIFYYIPNDAWHITSLQAIPFYFLAGIIITKTLKRFKEDSRFFIIMCVSFSVVFMFFV